MKNCMEYKGYRGSVEYSDEDKCLYGKILGIRSLILYEGNSVDELRTDFEGAVDDYLEYCRSSGKEPEKEYRGTFNLDAENHRKMGKAAAQWFRENL